jgi:hypothetical protein
MSQGKSVIYNDFKGDSIMTKSVKNHPLLILLSLITALSLVFSITTPAFAQKENPGKGGGSQGQGQEKALLKLFERLQAWQERQDSQFILADLIIEQMQDFIDANKSEGMDVEALQTALMDFKNQVKLARDSFQLAQFTIATHYGIDEKGEVYSAKTTRQTIKVASQSMGKSHRLLSAAVRNIRQAWIDWQPNSQQNLSSPSDLIGP